MRDVIARRVDPANNVTRFYAVDVEQMLFWDWAAVRQWGRRGVQGRSMETWFSDPFPSPACADQYEAAKRRGSYREAGC